MSRRRRAPVSLRWLRLALLVAIAAGAEGVRADYRHYYLDNADICGAADKGKAIEIGTGAAIFEVKAPSTKIQPNYRNKQKKCEINVKAPDGHGIMVYVEQMNLRRSSRDSGCVDYVQFGQDDVLPFITLRKSERKCGSFYGRLVKSPGFSYEDPHGDLLIWVMFGGRRETGWWPHISVVNLTLVATVYKKRGCRQEVKTGGYEYCGTKDRRCIYKTYFCDKHINCAEDEGQPRDEKNCDYSAISSSDDDGAGSGQDGDDEDGAEDLNLVSLLLIVVASFLMLVLFILFVSRWQRADKPCCCCCANDRASSSGGGGDGCPELPDRVPGPQPLAELSRRRRPVEENLYLPLTASAAAVSTARIVGDAALVGRPRSAAAAGQTSAPTTITRLSYFHTSAGGGGGGGGGGGDGDDDDDDDDDMELATTRLAIAASLADDDAQPPPLGHSTPEEPPPAYAELFPESDIRDRRDPLDPPPPPTTTGYSAQIEEESAIVTDLREESPPTAADALRENFGRDDDNFSDSEAASTDEQ